MIRAITTAFQMLSKHGFADIMQNNHSGEKSLHAATFFDAGETICDFTAEKIIDSPTYLTVQIGDEKHIILEPQFLQYINHSCTPNVFFDTHAMKLVALKDIQPGDELLYFYPSTEWSMTQPFECFCGTQQCLHHIQGAAFLSETEIGHYQFTPFIIEKIKTRKEK
jgi:hypothetical protein